VSRDRIRLPTHFVPRSSWRSKRPPRRARVPLIYNTNAYDSVQVLRLLDGIIDIYLPDLNTGMTRWGGNTRRWTAYAGMRAMR